MHTASQALAIERQASAQPSLAERRFEAQNSCHTWPHAVEFPIRPVQGQATGPQPGWCRCPFRTQCRPRRRYASSVPFPTRQTRTGRRSTHRPALSSPPFNRHIGVHDPNALQTHLARPIHFRRFCRRFAALASSRASSIQRFARPPQQFLFASLASLSRATARFLSAQSETPLQ